MKTMAKIEAKKRPADVAALAARIAVGAELPVLMMTAAHLTGDYSQLRDDTRPVPVFGVLKGSGSEARQLELINTSALRVAEFMLQNREVPSLTFDTLHRVASWATGQESEKFVPLFLEEVVSDRDLRRPEWVKDRIAPDRPFSVGIVGGGESGIILSTRLREAGVSHTIYEKNNELGGTWLENDYPGCRVDINSFLYSYASGDHIWSEYFGQQQEVLSYLQAFARNHDVYANARLGVRVQEAKWDSESARWLLSLMTEAGPEHAEHNVLVFAVGQLNDPAVPDIVGRDDFSGPAFHSARWDHSIDFTGKTVGVIGTGASACQFIPKLANVAGKVKIFCRTSTWLLPTEELHEPVSDATQWLMKSLPAYRRWYRASKILMHAAGMLERITVDPAYGASEFAVSHANAQLRTGFETWMRSQFDDRPDLEPVIIPDSPVGAKRILRDNGTWIRTLKRDNVEMVTEPIRAMSARGIECAGGQAHDCDILIYGTGFRASRFLAPVHVVGRDGADLNAIWDDDPRAYLGMAIPQFPNMFTMYGPNTNLVVHGGSMILFSELSVKYILEAVRKLLVNEHSAFEVRQDIFDDYNNRVDETNATRAWGFSDVSSWYKNSKGRVTQNYPFSIFEYWQRTSQVDDSAFDWR
ncbi:NAD(P)/FAD-dependent oxidoreductase [soil metagenome]